MNPSDRTNSKDLLVVGGADGIGMWLVKRVFGKVPEVGRITLADVKPLKGTDAARGGNPDANHVVELRQLPKPVDAVRLENGSDFADWAAVETDAVGPSHPLEFEDYGLVMLAVPEDQIEVACSAILPRLKAGCDESSTWFQRRHGLWQPCSHTRPTA